MFSLTLYLTSVKPAFPLGSEELPNSALLAVAPPTPHRTETRGEERRPKPTPPALTPNFRAARLQRPIVLNAKAFIPCHTLVLGSGDMAGIILADTID